MKGRLEAVRRVLRVQGQVRRGADMRLAEAGRAAAEAGAAREALWGFIDGDGPTGPLAALALAQARRLDERAAAGAAALAAAAEAAREAAAREKLAERAVAALAREAEAARGREELERLIEALAARPEPP